MSEIVDGLRCCDIDVALYDAMQSFSCRSVFTPVFTDPKIAQNSSVAYNAD